MWYVLKDEDHPDAPKMIKKGWIIGIILTVIDFAWIPFMLIPFMLIPFAFMGADQQMQEQMHQQTEIRLIPQDEIPVGKCPGPRILVDGICVLPVSQVIPDLPGIITESTQTTQSCDPHYPTVCIPTYPPDLDCGEISFKRFDVLQPDPHRFDGDKDGIGCES